MELQDKKILIAGAGISGIGAAALLAKAGVTAAISALTAASLLVFSLLYTPCVAAVSSIRRELGWRWAAGVIVWQCVLAWIAAVIVRLIGLAVGAG